MPSEHQVWTDSVMADGNPIIDTGFKYQRLDRAWVTASGHVCANNVLIMDRAQGTAAAWAEGKAHDYFYQRPPFRAYDPSTRTAIVDLIGEMNPDIAYLFATQNSQANFGHFIHDTLVQYPMYLRFKAEYPDIICLLAHEFRYPIQKAIVERLFSSEIQNKRLRQPNICGGYKQVVIPVDQFDPHHNKVNVAAMFEVRQILVEFARESTSCRSEIGEPAEKLFVSRRDGTSSEYGRNNLPHIQIESDFERQGFKVVCISNMSVEDILFSFRNASVVAGVHGAGLLNIVFSKHARPQLIELDTVTPGWASIERVCKTCGINYRRIRPQVKDDAVVYILDETVTK